MRWTQTDTSPKSDCSAAAISSAIVRFIESPTSDSEARDTNGELVAGVCHLSAVFNFNTSVLSRGSIRQCFAVFDSAVNWVVAEQPLAQGVYRPSLTLD